MYRIGRKS